MCKMNVDSKASFTIRARKEVTVYRTVLTIKIYIVEFTEFTIEMTHVGHETFNDTTFCSNNTDCAANRPFIAAAHMEFP